MTFKESMLRFFGGFGMGFITILQFIARQKLFYIIGFISFALTVIESITLAISQSTLEGNYMLYVGQIILRTLLNVAFIIFSIDNHLYKTAIEFSKIISPSIWTALWYLIKMSKDIFYYVWWWRVGAYLFKNAGRSMGTGTDQSTGNIDLINLILSKYVIFFMVMNFLGLFSMGIISLSTPIELTLFQKIAFFWNNNFTSPFDLIIKLFPFKGLVAFIIFSLGSIITILTGESVTATAINTTINKT